MHCPFTSNIHVNGARKTSVKLVKMCYGEVGRLGWGMLVVREKDGVARRSKFAQKGFRSVLDPPIKNS